MTRTVNNRLSIKRRGAYFIFLVIGAALVLERSLFQPRVKQRELTEARTTYAQFNTKYVHLELLYEPGFKSFPA